VGVTAGLKVEYDLRKASPETIRIILFHDGNIVRRELDTKFMYPSHSPAIRIVFDDDDYVCTGAAPHHGVSEDQVILLEEGTGQGDRDDGETEAVSRLHNRSLFRQNDKVYRRNCYYIGSAQHVSHGHSLDSGNAFPPWRTLYGVASIEHPTETGALLLLWGTAADDGISKPWCEILRPEHLDDGWESRPVAEILTDFNSSRLPLIDASLNHGGPKITERGDSHYASIRADSWMGSTLFEIVLRVEKNVGV